ncbi:MAG: glycosyltransferase family 2 protein [Coriobacteriales bacterium]|nr:glycosyltransferase family 2 protein [Coriobacteriales bacterium]
MELNSVGFTPIVIFNFITGLFFTVAYAYQVIYFLVVFKRGMVRLPAAKKKHSYAFVIAAHNEEPVIANLVRSALSQKYDGRVDCYVIADNCTDNTAKLAREAGATAWERNDLVRKGKSWALDYAFARLSDEYRDDYDAFFVMDADNIMAPNYVDIMNDAFDAGYLVCTSYRNSKNYDSSWISSAYATWFLREARFLNNARMACGTSCAISGSGWMVAASIVHGMHGWRFHTLTEDIQFSTFCCAQGIQIGYAPAEFFDEQPVDFKSSWVQRMRWTKGFYQVFFSYVGNLLHGMTKDHRFSSYDMLMTIAPGMLLSLLSALVNGGYLLLAWLSHGFFATQTEMLMCVGSLFMTFGSMYAVFFVVGLITTISERKHIYARKRWRLFTNLFTFPFFMLTYIPITVVALFKKVEWVPTKHDIAVNFDDVVTEQS